MDFVPGTAARLVPCRRDEVWSRRPGLDKTLDPTHLMGLDGSCMLELLVGKNVIRGNCELA